MLRCLSNRRSRRLTFAAIFTATFVVLWFRPVSSSRVILPLVAAGHASLVSNAKPLEVYHSLEELPAESVLTGLAPINWTTHNVIRVRNEAPGYQVATGGTTENTVQYGTITLSPRYGGRRWFAFLSEPTSDGVWSDVRQVSSALVREAWIAVPNGVEIQWIGPHRLQRLDAGFIAGALLLVAAALLALSSGWLRRAALAPANVAKPVN